jgi:arylsulfatase
MKIEKITRQAIRGAIIIIILAIPISKVFAQKKTPNILVIWGDDIGIHNISSYTHGMTGYKTPNIDRIAEEGALFTDVYAEQSCTAGRSAFILGQHPFRTGLLTIGMPGSEHGIPDFAPTLADMLKEKGYATGQFGKNHLGDNNKHLPTVHGFDEFYGNLYHLNAEQEPENYSYPKDPAFHEEFGPRGVLKAWATAENDPTVQQRWGEVGKQRIEDTGPLTIERMKNIDSEFLDASLDFIDRAHEEEKPFFVWFNSTRMHTWTHLKEESIGRSGVNVAADGLLELDDQVGLLLDKLEELKIDDNTIVIFSSDNGAQIALWPDGGITPFRNQKGTTWEGGHRVPLLVRWPGVFEPGTTINDIFAQNDWMPTLMAAVGENELVEKCKKGYEANGQTWKVHLDGYNFMPFFKGEETKGPRESYIYFDQGGNLNAVRWNDWKVHFAMIEGDIATGVRNTTAWPLIVNLRGDPYERAIDESYDWGRFVFDNMWIFQPVGKKVSEFISTIEQYPHQVGSSLSASGINYRSLKAMEVLKELENLSPPGN